MIVTAPVVHDLVSPLSRVMVDRTGVRGAGFRLRTIHRVILGSDT